MNPWAIRLRPLCAPGGNGSHQRERHERKAFHLFSSGIWVWADGIGWFAGADYLVTLSL
jgi:hypothetical protein